MEQQEARQEQQLAPSNGAHKLDALAEQEKNLAIFKTISSWLSSVVLRGHVLSYYVRPDRDKTDQRRQLGDIIKADLRWGAESTQVQEWHGHRHAVLQDRLARLLS